MAIVERVRNINKELPGVKLYLEDIYNLHSFLTEAYPTTQIETEDYFLTGIDDIKKLKDDHIDELNFRFDDGLLHISNRSSYIHFRHDNLQNRGIKDKVEELFNRRKRNILMRHGSIIFLKEKKKSPSFIFRNKDKIIIALISSLATAILGFIFAKWLSKLL